MKPCCIVRRQVAVQAEDQLREKCNAKPINSYVFAANATAELLLRKPAKLTEQQWFMQIADGVTVG